MVPLERLHLIGLGDEGKLNTSYTLFPHKIRNFIGLIFGQVISNNNLQTSVPYQV